MPTTILNLNHAAPLPSVGSTMVIRCGETICGGVRNSASIQPLCIVFNLKVDDDPDDSHNLAETYS